MAKKRWILVDFDSCPECGNDPEILTASDDPELFFDGDEVRCCQQCGPIGSFSCDEDGSGYINWHDGTDFDPSRISMPYQ